MRILDKFGNAFKSDSLQRLSCEKGPNRPFRVTAETVADNLLLGSFDNRDDAEAYIADLVHKLNGDTPEPDLRAITSLNDLVHIRDELKIIFDWLYPPLNRDNALTHTKELINYVESLIAEMEGANQ